MDDVRIQEIRAAAKPNSNIDHMLEWMKGEGPPIMTSRTHQDYPRLIEFPLESVLNHLGGLAYFNSTAAYAVAYAIYRQFDTIFLFGMDFTYPNSHDAEKGRGCVEFWLGYAHSLGIKVRVAHSSTLMDAREPLQHKLYGFDTLDVKLTRSPDGNLVAEYQEISNLPTAEEIEHRYDHSRHPNPIVEETDLQSEVDKSE
jgi:hypothetical protein